MPDNPQAKRRGLTRADVAAVLKDYPPPAKAVNHTERPPLKGLSEAPDDRGTAHTTPATRVCEPCEVVPQEEASALLAKKQERLRQRTLQPALAF